MNKLITRSIIRFRPARRPRQSAKICILLCAVLVVLISACSRAGSATAPAAPSETAAADDTDTREPEPSSERSDGGGQEETARIRASFDDWCSRFLKEQLETSFLNLHYSLVSPEAYGITGYKAEFGDFSLDGMRKERDRQKEFQKELAGIDPGFLDNEQKLTFRILTEAFRLEESGDGLELYYQPLAPSTGVQAQLPVLLAEFAFRERQDIEDYLELLSTIDSYYRQILDFEKEKAAAGLFMADSCADQITEGCDAYRIKADHNFMTLTFDQRIDAFDGLSDEERSEYKARNLAAVEEHFIPAYDLLSDGLTQLKGSGVNNQGLCYLPEGKQYYEYLVRSGTGTTYQTIEELRDAIAAQIDSDLAEMTDIIQAHPEVADQIMDYSFAYTGPEQILTQLQSQIAEDFPESPPCSYVTKYVPEELAHTLGPAFFLVPPVDDYDDCVIYINPDSTSDSQALYTTLAHEGIPGHMYQNTYFLSHCTNDLRKILSFTSYSEGWASYVENYSYTTSNGLSPELGRLLAHNAAANLGLHAIIDININYFGWTREQVKEFLAPYFDVSDESLVETIYDAMLNAPVNYVEYYVGYLEIIRMRDQARDTLGNGFSLKEFHRFLLDTGPAPCTVIREEFQTWLLKNSLER